MSGFGGSIFTMLGGSGKATFSMPEMPQQEKDPEKAKLLEPIRDPQEIIESGTFDVYESHKQAEWEEMGMMDGFTHTEKEKLTILYNQINENYEIWDTKYKEYYLLAANYSFRALRMNDQISPSTKEKLFDNLEAKRFIKDMNNILDGVLEVMKKFLPNSNSEFGIMCLFSHSYVGEIVACEMVIEQMKNEIGI